MTLRLAGVTVVGILISWASSAGETSSYVCTYIKKQEGDPSDDGKPFTFKVSNCDDCSIKNPIWENTKIDPDDYYRLDCSQAVAPAPWGEPNGVAVANHKKFCEQPRPVDNYEQCKEHCNEVEKNADGCQKQCRGNEACKLSCAGVCDASACRQGCEGAENARRDQRARVIAEKCTTGRPSNRADCHNWCNNHVQPTHEECVDACANRTDCNNICHGSCNLQACRNGCNGMPQQQSNRTDRNFRDK